MDHSNKRMNKMDEHSCKRVRKECSYGAACYRLNPAHLREYAHPHLEEILDRWSGSGSYEIPAEYSLQRSLITDQLNILVEKKLYQPRAAAGDNVTSVNPNKQAPSRNVSQQSDSSAADTQTSDSVQSASVDRSKQSELVKTSNKIDKLSAGSSKREKSLSPVPSLGARIRDSSYQPVVPPTRRAEEFLSVVRPRGQASAKHAASAPHHVFYTTIAAAKETHAQPYSITFLELLDPSLGELHSSLQLNFMVEPGWLLAQYYFAGYSAKKLTILYGEECAEMSELSRKKPHVDAVRVRMATPFGKHHTKLMVLCYEDGSVRVVVSTANLYSDDWENRTQGLWWSPRCGALPAAAPAHGGESPTGFKRELLRYLAHYRLPHLAPYVQRVQRCDFSHINVFFVASVPGSHVGHEWGMARAGALLRQHCAVPAADSRSWPVVAQASSLGSFGADPKMWLCGEFLQRFSRSKHPAPPLSPPLQLVYPSLQNVRGSHDGLLGGGCLPYARAAHLKQPWLTDYLYQWLAQHSGRSRAMPHIKSYVRARGSQAAYFLLTSANVSKAAWGSVNRGDGALRVQSYEAGVLLLPSFVINEDFFSLAEGAENRLIIPYDLPPTKYTDDMTAWVSDYLY